MHSDGSYSAYSPVVHGDIALSITTRDELVDLVSRHQEKFSEIP